MTTDLPSAASRRGDKVATFIGGALLGAVTMSALGMQMFTDEDTPSPVEAQQSASLQSACRSWDAALTDGTLMVTVGSIGEVADEAIENPRPRAFFLTGFDQIDGVLEDLDQGAERAEFASNEPGLDTTAYRTLRDLSAALFSLRDSTATGEALDVSKVRVPQVREHLTAVETLCRDHV